MRTFTKRLAFCITLYAAGVASGAYLVHALVFSHRGQQLAARVIEAGVIWINASTMPKWTVAIAPELEPVAEPEPVKAEPLRVARKGKR